MMPQRGRITLVACETCRKKKSRCNGARPKCRACKDSNAECTFVAQPGESRTSALKSEIARLKTSNSRLTDLYWQLKHANESDALALIGQIRCDKSVLDSLEPQISDQGNMQQPRSGIPEHVAPSSATTETSGKRPSEAAAIDALLQSYQTNDASSLTFPSTQTLFANSANDPADSSIADASPSNKTGQSSRAPFLPSSRGKHELFMSNHPDRDMSLQISLKSHYDQIREGFSMQRKCISEIFYCHDSNTVESLFEKLSARNSSPIPLTILCELCALAATSGQYVRGLIAPDLLDHWYDAARQYIDHCIERSPAQAIRVAALLGLYNLLNKSTVAIAYFEMGLSLAARYIRQQRSSQSEGAVPEDEFYEVIRTRRSLVFCNGWLQATLGYVSTSDWTDAIYEAHALPHANEHDLVQDEVSKIAILKATTMRTLLVCPDAPSMLGSIVHLRDQLREWYECLPPHARLIQLGTDSHIPLKTSVYYVHLLHLGAVMLMFRHCLAGLRSSEDREGLSVEQRRVMDEVLNDGILAAQSSAQMVYMIREASQSVRHCWVTIFQGYVSGMILLYHAMQLNFAGFSDEHWATSLDLVTKVMDVLNFCKELDPVARKFSSSLSRDYECFLRTRRSTSTASEAAARAHSTPPRLDHYLFISDSVPLHSLSRELLGQLCSPYANRHTTSAQHAEGGSHPLAQTLMLGGHDVCSIRPGCTPSAAADTREGITPRISNLEDGYFIDSNEPSWWTAKRSMATYSVGAETLEILR